MRIRQLLSETFGLDPDTLRAVAAWWRLRRIRKARARTVAKRPDPMVGYIPVSRAEEWASAKREAEEQRAWYDGTLCDDAAWHLATRHSAYCGCPACMDAARGMQNAANYSIATYEAMRNWLDRK